MSRFVSGGTIGPAGDDGTASSTEGRGHLSPPSAGGQTGKNPTGVEWEVVQQELENDRRNREEQRMKAATGEERSLYDVLQANKAAKQAAFEEQNKIRNQFRALDDDEIDFLDEVVAKKRMEEERVRKETEDGLRAFRDLQRKGDAGAGEDGDMPDEEEEAWGVGRKRRRGRARDRGLFKRRRSEGLDDGPGSRERGKPVDHGRGPPTEDNKGKIEQGKAAADDDGPESTEAVAMRKAEGEKLRVSAPREPVKSDKKSALVSYGSDDSDG